MIDIQTHFSKYDIIIPKNKYMLLYEAIINSCGKDSGYTELHHIAPRSLSKDNARINLIRLSTRKHFLCHYLLCKMFKPHSQEWFKMIKAFNMMTSKPTLTSKRYLNSRLYEYCRKNISEVMSESQGGNKNSQFGKRWVTNISLDLCEKIESVFLEKYLEAGWVVGRKNSEFIAKFIGKDPGNKGKSATPETRQKQSLAKKGKNLTEAHKNAISRGRREKMVSDGGVEPKPFTA
jgi:hypothetical protein